MENLFISFLFFLESLFNRIYYKLRRFREDLVDKIESKKRRILIEKNRELRERDKEEANRLFKMTYK